MFEHPLVSALAINGVPSREVIAWLDRCDDVDPLCLAIRNSFPTLDLIEMNGRSPLDECLDRFPAGSEAQRRLVEAFVENVVAYGSTYYSCFCDYFEFLRRAAGRGVPIADAFRVLVVATGAYATDAESCESSLVEAAREVGVADGEALIASMAASLQMTDEAWEASHADPAEVVTLDPAYRATLKQIQEVQRSRSPFKVELGPLPKKKRSKQ